VDVLLVAIVAVMGVMLVNAAVTVVPSALTTGGSARERDDSRGADSVGMNANHPSAHVTTLGTILSVWAHPDDETYLSAGIMSAARDLGQRVVCASATAGELGTADPDTWPPSRLGQVRRWEASAAMAVLGVGEHHILGLPDGRLPDHHDDGVAWAGRLIDDVAPDTILTFGPDGITFHSDHIAVHRWVTEAWHERGCPGRLLYASTTDEHLRRFGELYERWNVYMTDQRPLGIRVADLALHVRLDGAFLDRKLTALRAMATQTSEMVALLGETTYGQQVAEETFVDAAAAIDDDLVPAVVGDVAQVGMPDH
jgi:LmbE family N-acetylglucosaminyl deacetylase